MSDFAAWCGREQDVVRLLRELADTQDRRAAVDALSGHAREIVRDAHLHAVAISSDDVAHALEWLMRPVFICGHHRSGTTLLQELLDGHPQLAVLPTEVTYFASFPDVAVDQPGPAALDAFAAEWITRLADPHGKQHFHLGHASAIHNPSWLFVCLLLGWQAVLGRHVTVPRDLAALLALVAAYHDVAQPLVSPRMWVEKTPLNEKHVQRLAVLPQARFIQMVRDPAATLRSQLADLHGAGIADVDAGEQAWRICRSLRLARRNVLQLPSRYLVVRYEDLVSQPEKAMERVREFLGIESHPTLTQPTVMGHAVGSNSSFQRSPAGTIRAAPARDTLAPGERKLIETFGGDIAAEFGYPSVRTSALLRARRGAGLLRLAWVAARRRFRSAAT